MSVSAIVPPAAALAEFASPSTAVIVSAPAFVMSTLPLVVLSNARFDTAVCRVVPATLRIARLVTVRSGVPPLPDAEPPLSRPRVVTFVSETGVNTVSNT